MKTILASAFVLERQGEYSLYVVIYCNKSEVNLGSVKITELSDVQLSRKDFIVVVQSF